MEGENDPKIIDVEKVFKERNPKLFKLLPGFVFHYIRRVIHENEINSVLFKSRGITGIDFADLTIDEIGVKTSIHGLENVPDKGPATIAANHPLGGMDAMAMISLIGKKRKDIKFIVNDILTRFPNFGDLLVPVNKLGANTRQYIERIKQVYNSDEIVMIFPAGLCSRKIDGVIQDIEWNKSFVSNAQKYEHPIIPIFIRAKNSNRFYNLSRLRNALGIKANIEMFYLADEMFKQKGKSIELTIGKPIYPNQLSDDLNPKDWANLIRSFVYELEKTPELLFDDFIKNKKATNFNNKYPTVKSS